MALNALSENASRLGMRLQESFEEHTRDLNLRGSASLFDAPDLKNIRKQLDSTSDREKLDAMKRLIALISKNRNLSEYFAQVVKNVASQNLEIRKLVYIYLLRYSSFEPDLALLSINSFQKDLTDPSPLIRAMALRVLTGIGVPMIGSIVVLAIKKCAADTSPYVRKAAALAIPKCYELDQSHLPALLPILTTLLRDRSPLSIGSATVAFQAVCPTRLDLLHQQYRRLCRILVDVDEWGQVELMELLTRYARTMLPRPSGEEEEEMDKDLQLLLTSSEPLFQSRNPAVVLAVVRVVYYLAPPSHLPKILHPLLRLPHISPAVERVVLSYVLLISSSHPALFAPYYTRFLVRTDDIRQVKQDKISLLLNLITSDNLQAILREFIDCAEDVDEQIVMAALRAIGRCARLHPECMQQCLTALMTMIKSGHDVVVSNAVLVLKSLVQTQLQVPSSSLIPSSSTQPPLAIISHLARRIDDIRHSQARACVLWLVGQYSEMDTKEPGGGGLEGIADWAPDVLRKTAKTFSNETTEVKLQICTLAAKLLVLSPTSQPLRLLSRYVFSLARYDANYDVRDRTRMLVSLLAGLAPTLDEDGERGGVVLRREQVRRVLFEGKAGIIENGGGALIADEDHGMIGSMGVITGRDMRGDRHLPFWLEQGIASSLRDTEEDIPVVSFTALSSAQAQRSLGSSQITSPAVLTPTEGTPPGGIRGGSKGPWTDLDKFYEDDDSEEDGSENSDEEQDDNVEHEDEEEDGDGEEDDEDEEEEEEERKGEDPRT
ncbi:hypothetical protein PILCRDRAFT_818757 [Piloderma croceum F 1598]|uniref:Clathrin/coatomer adaptor adaptin-like N-terminal domain-containing protein n=1 Tax=Piloderma croceum (strain F 1598) TaxID=765440 RepID=A0A0C3G110_PILCF|nr:hypothetical protein PILCRDRAFT_818757 [Piloderma croceum F 1598]